MQNDVKEMLMCGDIADDFRMYFYSFPKHSYIKNGDERDIYNLLMRPKEYPDDADLDEKVERLVSSKKTNVIDKALVDIADRDKNFPKIILKNKYLFKTAFATSAQAVLSCARSYISWNPNKLQDSQALAEYVFSYGLENFRDFWESYSYWLSCSFPEIDDKTKVDIRGRLISIFGDNIEIFRGLYEEQNRKPRIVLEENAECSEFVLITEKELTLIPSRDIAISLINIGLIQDEDIEYVSSFLNKEPATNSSYEKSLSVYKHISSFSKSTDHWEKVITFLKSNRIIDVELFSFALSGIMEESEEDRSVIGSYLCEIQHDRIPDRYFELVDEYLIDKNLPDVVTDTLFEKQMLTSLVFYCADKGILSRYDFTSADYCESILESCQRLKKDRLDCMVLFRHEVLRQYLAINDAEFLCNKLDDLFYGEFPCISNEEMDSILDAITILKLLNRSKVTAENYLAVVEHLNSVADGTDVKDFFRYLLSTEFKDKYQDKAVVNKIIDELDYKKLCFEDLGEDDISEIIKYIKQYRDFNNFEVANSFMLLVNCLIPELEKVVAGRSVSRYVDAILQIGKPSDFTLSWIEETNVTFALPEEILDYLLQSNNMQKYLIGKVLLEKQFIFPYENVSDDIVLREYYPESPIWEHIKDNDFLIEFILKNEKYKDFDSSNYPENLLPLYKGKQTAVFAKHVLEHTNGDSQRNYLLNMGEICDEDNSVAISRLLIEDRFIDLLRDDELFERVYERLWENAPKHSGYKSFFSRKRNERVKDN